MNLAVIRSDLRQHNLFDTETNRKALPKPEGDIRKRRTTDGRFNDLSHPEMGAYKTRFGRNAPLDMTYGEKEEGQLLDPNPRLIANELMTRHTFQPATSLNVIAAAWLQFMVHDWFSHGPNDRSRDMIKIPRPEGDDWPNDPMLVRRTNIHKDDQTAADDGKPQTYVNMETHWWDASQIYGSTQKLINEVRADRVRVENDPDGLEVWEKTGNILPDGKVFLTPEGLLPTHIMVRESNGERRVIEIAGVEGNWWIGLSILQVLWLREHNHLCDLLKLHHPEQAEDGEWLFDKARLIISALIAKIHTVEWTPALLDCEQLRFAMRGNWWGILDEDFWNQHGRLSDSEIVSGITASPTDHHTAPFAMTEEFGAVYRMHPLMPDSFSIRQYTDDDALQTLRLDEVAGGNTRSVYREHGLTATDLFYSFGTSHPGALALNNYPDTLRQLHRQAPEDRVVDLATIDILRDRERGVPRYCDFRRMLHMKVPKTFEELTDNPEYQKKLRDIYGTVDKVDLLIGTLAETYPRGFAFSDTSFRIFALMASRRLKSDRFYTDDYTADVYTQFGLDWIRDNTFISVLTRHHPELKPALAGKKNGFQPWTVAGTF